MNITDYLSDARETEPVGAVVLHRLRDRHLGVYHDVLESPDGGAPLLGPGRVLTHDAVRDMTQRLSGSTSSRRILPGCVLVADTDLLVWWRPPTRRPIIFQTRDEGFNREMSGRSVLHPALLFVGRPKGLAVYALPYYSAAASPRPAAADPLCRAPYHNIYLTGAMCEGNVPMPAAPAPTEEVVAGYEAAFYDSAFAHTNIAGRVIHWPGGHDGLWRAMADARRLFPAHALVPLTAQGSPLTLGTVINSDARKALVDVQ